MQFETFVVNVVTDKIFCLQMQCDIFCSVQFSSVQDGIYALGKAHLSGVSPMLPLKQFQCWSDWWHPFLIFSRKMVERFLFLRLSPPGDRWCNVLGSVSSSSTLQIFQDATHLWWLLCPPVCLLCHFPLTPACPGQYTHRILWRRLSNIDTCCKRGYGWHSLRHLL